MEKPIIFENNKGQRLYGILHLPKTKKRVPLVIAGDGMNGSKTRPRFVELGRLLAKNHIALFRFDFTGQGDSEGDYQDVCLSQYINDLKVALKLITKWRFVDKNKIAFLGHSFASTVMGLVAGDWPAKTVVFWAPAFDHGKLIKRWYTKKEIKLWKRRGYIDRSRFRLGLKNLLETENINFINQVSKLKIPVLIIHGSDDDVIPISESRGLFKKLKQPKKLLIVSGGDHLLEYWPVKQRVLNVTIKWLLKYLK